MTKYKALIVVLIILLCGIVAVVMLLNNSEKQHDKFNIVTTFYPVQVIVDNIIQGTNNVNNVNISASVGGCVHDYELTPADMKVLESADVVVINGEGMEHFVEHITLKNGKLVNSSINVPNKEISSHVWLDLDNYISQIQTISNALCEFDVNNKEIYEKNAKEYIEKIQMLNNELNMVKSNTKVAIMHDSFRYYEKIGAYIVSAQFFSGHEGNYSANEIKKFIEEINNTNTTVLLVDNETYTNATQLVDTIKQETNVKVFILDLIVDVSNNLDEYIIKMKNNIQFLKEAISNGE